MLYVLAICEIFRCSKGGMAHIAVAQW